MNTRNYPTFPQQLSIPEVLTQAYGHWNASQDPQAEHLCRRVLEVEPTKADASHLLGLIAHAYGNLNLGINYVRQACFSLQAPAIYFSNLAEMCCQKGLLIDTEQAA